MIQQAFTSAERVAAFLNAPKEEEELGKDGEIFGVKLQGRLEFRNVTMGYDLEKIVLNKINFEILINDLHITVVITKWD